MNFVQAIQSGFRNYVNFNGRASRSEFWWWMLFALLFQLAAALLFGDGSRLDMLATLAVALPSLAVGARRLHDTDRSGWWQLLCFLPIIGMIVLIVWWCRAGTPGENRFGPDPLPLSAAAPASA